MPDAEEVEGGFTEVPLPVTADDADQRTGGQGAGFVRDGDGEANVDLTQWAVSHRWPPPPPATTCPGPSRW